MIIRIYGMSTTTGAACKEKPLIIQTSTYSWKDDDEVFSASSASCLEFRWNYLRNLADDDDVYRYILIMIESTVGWIWRGIEGQKDGTYAMYADDRHTNLSTEMIAYFLTNH